MHCNRRNHGITNLYLRNKRPNQEKELQYYSVIERNKYNPSPMTPELDERVISEDAVKKMAKTVLRYKGKLDNPHDSSSLGDALSAYECTARRFVRDTDSCEGDMDDGIRDAYEQTKTMLLYGEMDSLFRLASHPSVRFYKLWDEEAYANGQGFGLSELKDSALQTYICLNVMALKPELYDATSRQAFIQAETAAHRTTFPPSSYDYRLTAAYQRMLLCCTDIRYGARHYEAHAYPHREFFGIPRGYFDFDNPFTGLQRSLPGTVRISELAEDWSKGVHLASKTDIPILLDLLRTKKLPPELALQVLSMADYKPVGRLFIREDPLHLENSNELKKYLGLCWKLLIRIDMLIKASGQSLDWEGEAAYAMCTLLELNHPNCRRPYRTSSDYDKFNRPSPRFVSVAR
jgi:hypothetical protein